MIISNNEKKILSDSIKSDRKERPQGKIKETTVSQVQGGRLTLSLLRSSLTDSAGTVRNYWLRETERGE